MIATTTTSTATSSTTTTNAKSSQTLKPKRDNKVTCTHQITIKLLLSQFYSIFVHRKENDNVFNYEVLMSSKQISRGSLLFSVIIVANFEVRQVLKEMLN